MKSDHKKFIQALKIQIYYFLKQIFASLIFSVIHRLLISVFPCVFCIVSYSKLFSLLQVQYSQHFQAVRFTNFQYSNKLIVMQESFVEVNSIQTQILSIGHKIGESFDENVKEVVLVISGCPGIPTYYPTYLRTIYNYLDKKMPVIVIGHAGMVENDDIDLKIPKLKGNKHLFDKAGNIAHKVRQPNDPKLFL